MEKLSDLKKNIFNLVTKQRYWKRTVKPTCAILEHILQEKKMFRIIKRKELFGINETLDIEFRLVKNDITTLLKHLHRAGTLLYFEEPTLEETIILDVQWLVDAFKSILAYYVGIENAHDIEPQRFKETGELFNEQLLEIWKGRQAEGEDYVTYKDVLTSFMEKLGLLAVCQSEDESWYYFPSMNRRKFDDKQFEHCKKSSILIFQFDTEKQLPIFVFYRFVIKCMKLHGWKILVKKQCRCIYDEVACFSFQQHIVLLCISNYQIEVQVCHPANHIGANLLEEIKSMLKNTMDELTNQKYSFKIGYKCENGKFKDDEYNFIPEMELSKTDEKNLCLSCQKTHTLGNRICWVNLNFILLILISKYLIILRKTIIVCSCFSFERHHRKNTA